MKPRVRFSVLAVAAAIVVLVIAYGTLRWDWGRFVADTAKRVHEEYGVNLPLAIALFGGGEVVFLGSIAAMVKEAGEKATWSRVHAFRIRDLNLGSRRMTAWLWVNRAAWVIPWMIVIVLSIGRVPWWATTAALGEVAVTLAVGVVITFGLRLPWWNSGQSNHPSSITIADSRTTERDQA